MFRSKTSFAETTWAPSSWRRISPTDVLPLHMLPNKTQSMGTKVILPRRALPLMEPDGRASRRGIAACHGEEPMLDQFMAGLSNEAQLRVALRMAGLALPIW